MATTPSGCYFFDLGGKSGAEQEDGAARCVGGIAAYKAVALCSKLVQAGATVDVVMTDGALKFVTPLTFQAISRRPVLTDTFKEEDPAKIAHIDVAERADLILIAPASANVIARLAHGFADDMLTTAVLASTAPLWVAPAMNVHMYAHPAVQANLEVLRKRGVRVLEPGTGPLACGYTGKGRLPEPDELFAMINDFFCEQKSGLPSGLAGRSWSLPQAEPAARRPGTLYRQRFIGKDGIRDRRCRPASRHAGDADQRSGCIGATAWRRCSTG